MVAKPPSEPRRRPSLRAQGLAYLSRREHSRQELRTKLLSALRRHMRLDAAAAEAEAAASAREAAEAAAPSAFDAGWFGQAQPPGPALAADPLAAAFSAAFNEGPVVQAPAARGRSAARPPGRGPAPASAPAAPAPPPPPADDLSDPVAAVDAALDWLEARGYLSDPRFVENRVATRLAKHGSRRIQAELSQHGLQLDAEQAAQLRETEFDRARALWLRKFGEPAADPKARAKQARFLAARGFPAGIVRRLVGGDLGDEG